MNVRLGEHKISTDIDCDNRDDPKTCYTTPPLVQDIQIEKKFIHSDYQSLNKVNDIAVVKLVTDVIFNDFGNVETICLPTRPEHMINYHISPETQTVKFSIAGWGFTEYHSKFSDVLRHATIDYVHDEDCSKRFATIALKHSWISTKIEESQLVRNQKAIEVD